FSRFFSLCFTFFFFFFFSSRRRHTRFSRDWSSDVCSSDLSSVPTSSAPASIATSMTLSSGVPGANRNWPQCLNWNATEPSVPRRSEERRVGKECRARWRPDAEKEKEGDIAEWKGVDKLLNR